MGTWGFFPGVKHPGPEADRSLPSSTEVKNGGRTPIPICLHGVVLNLLSTRILYSDCTTYTFQVTISLADSGMELRASALLFA